MPGSDLTGALKIEGPAGLPFVLKYNSQDANTATVAFDYTLDPFQALPTSISAQVTVSGGGYSYSPVAIDYSTAGFAPGTTVRLMQDVDLGAHGFPAGHYNATMVVKDGRR